MDDKYFSNYNKFVNAYSEVPKVHFFYANKRTFDTTSLKDYDKSDNFTFYVIKEGGVIYKYPYNTFNINLAVSFTSKIISQSFDFIPNHRQKCLLPLLTQKVWNKIYEEGKAYIVLSEVDSTTLEEKLEVG